MQKRKPIFFIERIRCCTWMTAGLFCCLCFLLAGCGTKDAASSALTSQETQEKDYSILLPGSYDSRDTSVLLAKDEEKSTLTFFNLTKKRNYTLSYDGTTKFYDKYDSGLALSQVQEGTIVDVTFLKNSKKLNTLQVSKEAWSTSQVRRFEFDGTRKSLTLGEDTYRVADDLVVMQDSEQMEQMDINAADVLTINGIGNSVYSVQIEKGHGYLRLTGDEYFIGGWIEVGQALIREITDGMLLTVPEGTYDVTLSHNGVSGVRQVTIPQNEEVELDVSELKGEIVKTGTILFTVNVEDAQVFVDGNPVDISGPVELDYGIHQLMAKATGYKTSMSYLKVAQESAGISIVLDKEDEDDSDSSSDKNNSDNSVSENDNQSSTGTNTGSTNGTNTGSNTGGTSGGQNSSNNNESNGTGGSSGNSGTTVSGSDLPTNSDSYRVYIDNPAGVEVYLDGNYVGVAPVSFKKAAGTHVITLRKKGYETRSYTISVDNEKRDVSYSFIELEQES